MVDQSQPEPIEEHQQAPALPPEETFDHILSDGTRVIVGKPIGVLRLKLRNLLGDLYSEDEYKTMGTAFLSVRKWMGFPSPLTNKTQFEAMISRFASDEDLDLFMEKWQKLTQPELSKIITDVMTQALDENWSEEQTREVMREKTAPLAKAKLDRLRD